MRPYAFHRQYLCINNKENTFAGLRLRCSEVGSVMQHIEHKAACDAHCRAHNELKHPAGKQGRCAEACLGGQGCRVLTAQRLQGYPRREDEGYEGACKRSCRKQQESYATAKLGLGSNCTPSRQPHCRGQTRWPLPHPRWRQQTGLAPRCSRHACARDTGMGAEQAGNAALRGKCKSSALHSPPCTQTRWADSPAHNACSRPRIVPALVIPDPAHMAIQYSSPRDPYVTR